MPKSQKRKRHKEKHPRSVVCPFKWERDLTNVKLPLKAFLNTLRQQSQQSASNQRLFVGLKRNVERVVQWVVRSRVHTPLSRSVWNTCMIYLRSWLRSLNRRVQQSPRDDLPGLINDTHWRVQGLLAGSAQVVGSDLFMIRACLVILTRMQQVTGFEYLLQTYLCLCFLPFWKFSRMLPGATPLRRALNDVLLSLPTGEHEILARLSELTEDLLETDEWFETLESHVRLVASHLEKHYGKLQLGVTERRQATQAVKHAQSIFNFLFNEVDGASSLLELREAMANAVEPPAGVSDTIDALRELAPPAPYNLNVLLSAFLKVPPSELPFWKFSRMLPGATPLRRALNDVLLSLPTGEHEILARLSELTEDLLETDEWFETLESHVRLVASHLEKHYGKLQLGVTERRQATQAVKHAQSIFNFLFNEVDGASSLLELREAMANAVEPPAGVSDTIDALRELAPPAPYNLNVLLSAFLKVPPSELIGGGIS